jgi:hypothetical protein
VAGVEKILEIMELKKKKFEISGGIRASTQ